MIKNTSGEDLCGEQGCREAPERPRHRRRGFWHTLAAEWFQLRISVITFRSVIYSWPLAATHDPPAPPAIWSKEAAVAVQTALSVNSNGFTACFFSLVSVESCADTGRKGGFVLQDLTLPTWIYSPDHSQPRLQLVQSTSHQQKIGSSLLTATRKQAATAWPTNFSRTQILLMVREDGDCLQSEGLWVKVKAAVQEEMLQRGMGKKAEYS